MIIIKEIPTLVNTENRRTTTIPYDPDKRIIDILRDMDIAYEDKDVIIRGALVTDLKNKPKDGDEIIVNTHVGDVIGAIWAIGSWLVEAFVEHWITYTIMALTMAYSVYSAVSTKTKMPSFGSIGGEGMDEASPTYGWDGIVNTQEVGVPVAIVYGRHRIGGNIINQYVSTDGDKNYLNMLIALGEGEINDISSIKINENPIENFSGITTYERMGTNAQTVIPNFEDLHSIITINQPLMLNSAYTYTTIETDTEAFEITLNLPNGIFQVDASGAITSWEVTYKVEYKLHSSGTWIDLGSTTISGKSRTALKRIFRKDGLTAGQYDIRITRTSADSSLDPQKTADLYLQSIDEIVTDDLAYPNTALLGIKALATDQLSGATPTITCLVEGRLISVPKIMNGASEVDWEDYYWDPATSQWKLLSDGTVLTWDGTTYVDKWCANPIWCLKDLMTNGRYGLGEYIDSTYINDADFLTMAKYCEERVADGAGGYEKRFRLDCVIDSTSKALDILIQICATFRAFPYFANGKISIGIDKPQTTDTQVFGMGNIEKGSLSETWKSYQDIPNVIEVTFMDQDLDYKQETIVVTDETALSASAPVKKKQIRIFTTKKSYAIREGRYALYVAKYITRTLRFTTDLRAIVSLPGDRIAVSHDVPQWGFSGKIQSGSTTTTIKLDRTVTIEAGKTYEIMVQHADDDTVETKLVTTSTPGSYTELTTQAFTKAPGAFSDYAFGEQNISTKPYRLIGVKKFNDGRGEVTAIEYNSSVYDDTAPTIPTNNYSSLSADTPDVTDLVLTERIAKLADGTIEDVIDVWFQKPALASYHIKKFTKAKIYLSDDGGVSWTLRGETTETHFAIQGDLVDLGSYRVAVISVDDAGKENAISASPYEDIQILGKHLPPETVDGFSVTQDGDDLVFSWAPNPDIDLFGYEIRQGDDWDTGTVIETDIQHTSFRMPIHAFGAMEFHIKAIDTSRNYSLDASSANITITSASLIEDIGTDDLDNFSLGTIEPSDENTENVIDESDVLVVDEADEQVVGNPIPGFEINDAITSEQVIDEAGEYVVDESDTLVEADSDAPDFLELIYYTDHYATQGIYTTPVQDLTAKMNARIMLTTTVEGDDCSYALYIRVSDDNVTWGAWQEYAPGVYACRYYQVKIVVTTNDTTKTARVRTLKAFITANIVFEGFDDVVVADIGTPIVFTKTFLTLNRIYALAQGADKTIEITNKTLTGCTAKIKEISSGNYVAGIADILVQGY